MIGAQHPAAAPTGFSVVTTSHAGEGEASTADRVRLRLEYDGQRPTSAPLHLVYKTVLAAQRTPTVMCETEVRFYERIRPDLAIETPRCFGTSIDRQTGRFAILLEDLTDRSATFPDAVASLTVSQVEMLLANLASMHARFWRSARFDGDLAWVPMTLLHGDNHVGNTYVMPDGSAGFLDWQLMARGRWAHDVIYLLATSMAPSVRQRHQEALLCGYLAELEGNGATDVPDEEQAWELCRRAALWGLVIGWLITPPENYGRDITVANLERVIAVVEELDTLA